MDETSPAPRATTLRLDDDVRHGVDAYAQRTRRTLNSAVNYLLESGLERELSPLTAEPPAPADPIHTR